MLCRASSRASSRSPAWACKAPQHPCPAGMWTSIPFCVSTFTVARFRWENATLLIHPATKATCPRFSPAAGKTLPISSKKNSLSICAETLSRSATPSSFRGEGGQAGVHMLDKRIAHRHLAFIHLQHLVDASPRRIHFHAQHFVGGAVVQAEPAVDTR